MISSMEIFAFHPGLNKWVEIGNSGMFRPEMLLPMGLPGNHGQISTNLLILMVTATLKFDYFGTLLSSYRGCQCYRLGSES